MAALRSICGHYIFRPVVSSFFKKEETTEPQDENVMFASTQGGHNKNDFIVTVITQWSHSNVHNKQ